MQKIPSHLLNTDDPIFEFNKQIIDATHDLCVAYKPNIAFYESMGSNGWNSLKKTLEYIPKEIFTIADAKRGDIGNTSKMYAKTFLKLIILIQLLLHHTWSDSVKPFLDFDGKWAIVLALTSNHGGLDFQLLKDEDKKCYIKRFLKKFKLMDRTSCLLLELPEQQP